MDLLPWQDGVWQQLGERGRNLPHALLLQGPNGVGKARLALTLAGKLLCEQPGALCCGHCQVCQLIAANTMPDLHILCAERTGDAYGDPIATLSQRYRYDRSKTAKPGERIRVDQIRSLIDALLSKPQIATGRVAIIIAADDMNANAANALLKLLEEPRPSTWFVLTSARGYRLPATIRSRCICIAHPPPAHEAAMTWLEGQNVANAGGLLALSGGGPLAAAALADTAVGTRLDALIEQFVDVARGDADPIRSAARWPTEDVPLALRVMQLLAADLLRIGNDSQSRFLSFPNSHSQLQGLTPQLDLQKVSGLYDRLSESIAVHDGVLNARLIFEDIMMHVADMQGDTA